VEVEVDPARLAAAGLTLHEVRGALQSANMGLPLGDVLAGNQAIAVQTGPFLQSRRRGRAGGGQPRRQAGVPARGGHGARRPPPPARYVWHGAVEHADGKSTLTEQPAVTLAVTKKPGENAIDVANAVMRRVGELQGTVIPSDVQVSETRNYGATANDKARS
jgi:multidrug efflux pump subunit AcrB